MPETLLIVDDDDEFRDELREALSGYEVKEASNGQEALALLSRAHEIDLVILDVNMPGLSGLGVLREIKKSDPPVRTIILTGHSSKDVAIEALKGHADDYLEKPVDPEKVRALIEKLLEKKHSSSEVDTADKRGKIEKVKRFLERNCFKKSNLTEAAQAVCLSPKYLSRIFKEETGESYVGYRLKTKIEKAKGLLLHAGHNVNQISEKLGYENTESFIRQFKKLSGQTPAAYRKKTMHSKSKKK